MQGIRRRRVAGIVIIMKCVLRVRVKKYIFLIEIKRNNKKINKEKNQGAYLLNSTKRIFVGLFLVSLCSRAL